MTAKDQSRIHQFGKNKFYLDCSSDTLCTQGGIWKGDVLIADLEELETMDASEIYSKRLNAKEVIYPNKENLFFQSQMDESKPLEEMARRMGSPRQVSNRRLRTREGPEPACVRAPYQGRVAHAGVEG